MGAGTYGCIWIHMGIYGYIWVYMGLYLVDLATSIFFRLSQIQKVIEIRRQNNEKESCRAMN